PAGRVWPGSCRVRPATAPASPPRSLARHAAVRRSTAGYATGGPAAPGPASVRQDVRRDRRRAAQNLDSWARSGRARQRGLETLLQTLCRGVLERLLREVGDIEDVLGALTDGADACALQVDAFLPQHLADIAEQAGAVAGDQFQCRA